ncbi:hypothetical protein FH972_023859 [Carpinus fangiana]|uniref:Glycerophosphocholine acyltransferase 1 n=1 Tax=Carpinus fangiana TaxID=176857 RepID=A0A5N6KWR9_9ROSI|nr:hypothetical protein FH972_023859 [Carpinus fangiana]
MQCASKTRAENEKTTLEDAMRGATRVLVGGMRQSRFRRRPRFAGKAPDAHNVYCHLAMRIADECNVCLYSASFHLTQSNDSPQMRKLGRLQAASSMSSDPIDIPTKGRPDDGSVAGSAPGSPYMGSLDAHGVEYSSSGEARTPGLSMYGTSASSTPGISRSGSFSNSSEYADAAEGIDPLPPLDRLTLFDFLENLALPQRLEKMQMGLQKQSEKIMRQQQKIREQAKQSRERIGGELRKRIPGPDERLRKYRRSMRDSVDRLGKRWKEDKTVSLREKISFIAGVLNIFISGYLVGAHPEYFYLWYTIQLAYFYPIRYYTYHKRGMHYFLADLCYYVNFLLVLSIWVFPSSKRLFIATFCLAFGNNAVAIAMWRNSLVFHSLDKVTRFVFLSNCLS